MKNINIRKVYYHLRHRYFTMNNVVMTIALLVGVGWAWASVGAMQRNYNLQKEVDDKARQAKLIELETQSLVFEQKYFKSTEYQELALRERLGLANPGEKVLMLPSNTDAAKKADASFIATPQVKASDEPVSNYQLWMNFLFGGNSKDLK
jgi:cell division protein FtsB